MKIACVTALAALLTIAPWGMADSPAPPVPWVKTSERGDFLFKMVPEKGHVEGGSWVVDQEAFGVAYAINAEGGFDEIWRVKGWYTFEGYLSQDGRYFVRLGPWASDQEKHTDLAIAFYDRGKLLQEYQVRKLIKKPELLENSVSHYRWRPTIQTDPTGFQGDSDLTFHLVMIDKTTYAFDVATGKITGRGRDAKALGFAKNWVRENAEAEEKGKALYESSDFRKDYDQHFTVSNFRAASQTEDWRANLVPKKEYPAPCSIFAVFDMHKRKLVKVEITADEINRAFQKVFTHPFVAQRLNADSLRGVRMQITANRLNWDFTKLTKNLGKVTGTEPEDVASLRPWAEVILDEKVYSGVTSVYVDTASGDIIYEDASRDFKPVLLDAAGDPKESQVKCDLK